MSNFKACFISDTHNFHNDLELPDADILFHTGDFTLIGDHSEVYDFNEWLGTLKQFAYKVVIAGNHDKCVGMDQFYGVKHITNAIYLQNSAVEIEGFKIWGSPMTPAFQQMRAGLTFYTNSDREAKGVWRGMPRDTDILLTHGPPYGYLDVVVRNWDYMMTEHVGDKMLLDKVNKVKPKYHAFGHVHEGYGIHETDDTTFINCSVINGAYNLVNEPIVMYL